MVIGVLNRPRTSAVTELDTELFPETDPVARLSRIAGGIQDHSVTVIENPAYSGLTGFLVSQHFRKTSYGEIELSGVNHYRAGIDEAEPRFSRDHPNVRIRKGFDNFPYSFAESDGLLLPNASLMPYEICFISPDEFAEANRMMKDPNRFKDGVIFVYQLVARKSDKFMLDGEKLSMPSNYASMIIGQ